MEYSLNIDAPPRPNKGSQIRDEHLEDHMSKLLKSVMRLVSFGSAKAATNGVIGLDVEDGGRPFDA